MEPMWRAWICVKATIQPMPSLQVSPDETSIVGDIVPINSAIRSRGARPSRARRRISELKHASGRSRAAVPRAFNCFRAGAVVALRSCAPNAARDHVSAERTLVCIFLRRYIRLVRKDAAIRSPTQCG
jgi:hypothetical protein